MFYFDFLDWNAKFLADWNELQTAGMTILGELFAQKLNFTFVESSFDCIGVFRRRCKPVSCGWTFHDVDGSSLLFAIALRKPVLKNKQFKWFEI